MFTCSRKQTVVAESKIPNLKVIAYKSINKMDLIIKL